MSLTIGVVGTGAVGTALAGRLLKKGYRVVFGSREPESAKSRMSVELPGAVVDTVQNATKAADVILLARPGAQEKEVMLAIADYLGPGVKNKVVIDASNPLSAYPNLEIIWDKTSGGEMMQEVLPSSFVFKAFNSVPLELIENPDRLGQKLTVMFAGSKEQKDVMSKIIEDVGFIPAYVGPIRFARNLEAIAELKMHLGNPNLALGADTWGHFFHFQPVRLH